MQHIKIKSITIGNDLPFTLIAGPCQIESLDHSMFVAEYLSNLTNELDIPLIFKSSFDKANRTSGNTPRGVGLEAALVIFDRLREAFDFPILTDVHNEAQCEIMAEYVDVLQIPAFLCRQTDLLKAAAMTGKVINVKKGQFLAPWDMKNVIDKIHLFGNENAMATERGACFGYNTLVSDMRSLPIMAENGTPVIFDATHSVQQPGKADGASGGERKYVRVLAKAAVAVGVAGVFIETHPDPDNAPSDGPCMIKLSDMKNLLIELKAFDAISKGL